ncbi:hypothetical protein [Shewanella surugensis]|uniref:Uncharacterized protein n=1 Tax=Shewanella surugensis TaxID=212020 RepID=A0ABT0LH50_9GAMM|nr:hypothetical protein [Shewanella surugensis]MCL1126670.1 hypothetical protein [Shewanella surugensis]
MYLKRQAILADIITEAVRLTEISDALSNTAAEHHSQHLDAQDTYDATITGQAEVLATFTSAQLKYESAAETSANMTAAEVAETWTDNYLDCHNNRHTLV